MADNSPRPVEIRPHTVSKILEIEWDDGEVSKLTYEHLRVECPCADCKGHGPGQEKTITGKKDIDILDFQPVGNYAIQLQFDDGHDTGIYTWDYLRRLGASAQD